MGKFSGFGQNFSGAHSKRRKGEFMGHSEIRLVAELLPLSQG